MHVDRIGLTSDSDLFKIEGWRVDSSGSKCPESTAAIVLRWSLVGVVFSDFPACVTGIGCLVLFAVRGYGHLSWLGWRSSTWGHGCLLILFILYFNYAGPTGEAEPRQVAGSPSAASVLPPMLSMLRSQRELLCSPLLALRSKEGNGTRNASWA